MTMTPAQYDLLAAAVAADPVLSLLTQSSTSAFAIMDAFNVLASPETSAWSNNVPVDKIHDGIDYTKYTPADAPDETATYTNRVLIIQTKQMNMQNMLVGRTTVDASKANLRNGLKDATTVIPAGTGGANVNPGGIAAVNVLNALIRPEKVTRGEKVLSTGPATTGNITAEVLGYYGLITKDDVDAAMGW